MMGKRPHYFGMIHSGTRQGFGHKMLREKENKIHESRGNSDDGWHGLQLPHWLGILLFVQWICRLGFF
jgi:hypothetical protein